MFCCVSLVLSFRFVAFGVVSRFESCALVSCCFVLPERTRKRLGGWSLLQDQLLPAMRTVKGKEIYDTFRFILLRFVSLIVSS